MFRLFNLYACHVIQPHFRPIGWKISNAYTQHGKIVFKKKKNVNFIMFLVRVCSACILFMNLFNM